MRIRLAAALILLLLPLPARADVVKVTITARTPFANGQSFGMIGPYEHLTGTIEFALDPREAHNRRIVDLDRAPRAADGKVHFTSDLHVLQPVDVARGNGVLLFEISNRGGTSLLDRFNNIGTPRDKILPDGPGNGFLMRNGYSLVWVGWEFDNGAGRISVDAPPAQGVSGRVTVETIPNARGSELTFSDAPRYHPARLDDRSATLTVRNRFWDPKTTIARERWTFVASEGAPKVKVEGGVEPGRIYEVTFTANDAVVAGVGLAATRDAASAFRYRTDLPIHGKATYVFGASQSGRFLRQFLYDGFNADESDRRVFDAVWPHIAGSARGSFNERFATPTSTQAFTSTRPPMLDAEVLAQYRPELQPKIIYTNTPVEYWGQGRAAALIHTSLDGKSDAQLPENVRVYFLAGSQHGESAFPPRANANAQQLPNPTPQREVMRALLTGLHRWVSQGTAPPPSRYPKLADGTLVPVEGVKFPAIPGISDPRTIPGPGLVENRTIKLLPFLVPQVEADGNDASGIRVPDQMVPLATTTGWNFRSESAGNPADILALTGSFIPFSRTKAERDARHDPRLSIEERYPGGRADYLAKISIASAEMVKEGYLLPEDVDSIAFRAFAHWDYATKPPTQTSSR